MRPRLQDPDLDLLCQGLVGSIARELHAGLGERELPRELVTEIYDQLRYLLARSGALWEDSRPAPGLVNELALAIFLVAVSAGCDSTAPRLLPALERALSKALADAPAHFKEVSK